MSCFSAALVWNSSPSAVMRVAVKFLEEDRKVETVVDAEGGTRDVEVVSVRGRCLRVWNLILKDSVGRVD